LKATVTIKKNSEFRRIYSKGKSAATPLLVLYVRRGPNRDGCRLGITVSTKLGKAVVRNRIRRRFREIFRLNKDKMKKGFDVIVVARVRSRNARYDELERDFLKLASKLELIQEGKTHETNPDISC